jgi:TRAP-type C4-dicarboxylate transport system substrate-binding protein
MMNQREYKHQTLNEEGKKMKKKRFQNVFVVKCLMLALIALPLVAGGVNPGLAASQEKVIELALDFMIPATSPRWTGAIKPWIGELEKRTKGRVKIIPYFSSSLGSMFDTYDRLLAGAADLAEGVPRVTPGRFPLNEASSMVRLDTIVMRPGRMMWELYKQFPQMQAEYSDAHLIWISAAPAMGIATVKKPVRTLEDLKGLKLWAVGKWLVKRASNLGISPVAFPTPDVYLAVQKGTIDGVIANPEFIRTWRVLELVKHYTETNFENPAFFMIMNKKRWNTLPPDIQKIFNDLSGDYAVDLNDTGWVQAASKTDKEACIKKGVKFYKLPTDEMARWVKADEKTRAEFANSLEAKGLPARKFLKELDRLAIKYSAK